MPVISVFLFHRKDLVPYRSIPVIRKECELNKKEEVSGGEKALRAAGKDEHREIVLSKSKDCGKTENPL